MKDLMRGIITNTDLGTWPTIGLIILLLTLLAVVFWTYRPKAKKEMQKQAELTLD